MSGSVSDKTMKQYHSVIFRFKGDNIDVQRINNLLHLSPTKYFLKDDDRVLSGHFKPYWSISSPLQDFDELDKHIYALLSILLPKKNIIKMLGEEGYSPMFYIGIFFHEFAYFHIESELLKCIADLHSDIEVHMYDLKNEESDIQTKI